MKMGAIRLSENKENYTLPHIPLEPAQQAEYLLNKARHAQHDCHNLLVQHAHKLLHKLHNTKQYQKTLKRYQKAKNILEHAHNEQQHAYYTQLLKDSKQTLKEIRQEIGLTENDFQKWINQHRKEKYAKILNSDAVQKDATNVWQAVAKVLFGKSKKIHYQKWDDFHALHSKSAKNHVILQKDDNGLPTGIKWNKQIIPFKRELNDYERTAFLSEVRYIDIVYEQYSDGWHYYANIALYGHVPVRADKGKGTLGLDPGTSTMAFSGKEITEQVLLAPHAEQYDERIADLSRRIDQSMRTTNPDYYNSDGTYKKRKKGEKRTWKLSRHCRALKRKRKVLYRKKAAATKQSHSELGNRVVSKCSAIKTEPMNYAGLMKKAKASKDDKGKWRKRKRFGKSIGSRAPSEFLSILAWKCRLLGIPFSEVNSYKVKASQFDHVSGAYTKVGLSVRWKRVGHEYVQRDLYSAFLLAHVLDDGETVDVGACWRDFSDFISGMNEFVVGAIVNDMPRNSCFGF